MWSRILIGIALFLLGYYVGKQVERDAPTRDWLRKRQEERERKVPPLEERDTPPPSAEKPQQ